MGKFLEKIGEVFRAQKFFYYLVLLFFCIGVVIGVYTVMYMEQSEKSDLISYFTSYINGMDTNTTSYGMLLFTILKKNLLLIIPIVLLAFTFFGAPIILIMDLVKGFSLGYSFTFLVSTFDGRGLGIAMASVLPQNIIYIPCIIILSVMGLSLSTNNFKAKFFKHTSIRKIEILKEVSSSLLLVAGMFLLGVLVETYLSPNIIKVIVTKFYI